MTLHDPRLLAEAERTRRQTIHWRKHLILRRGALVIQWHQLFPHHDFGDMRLNKASRFDLACDEAERKASRKSPPEHKPRSTPQSTIDAVLYCVRDRGLAALREPANLQRLAEFDDSARQQLDALVSKLKKESK